MKRSSLYIFLTAIVLLALARWLDQRQSAQLQDPCYYANIIQNYLQKEHVALDLALENTDWQRIIPLSDKVHGQGDPEIFQELTNLESLTGNLHIYQDSQLVFWSDERYSIPDSLVQQLRDTKDPIILGNNDPILIRLHSNRLNIGQSTQDVVYIYPLRSAFMTRPGSNNIIGHLKLSDSDEGCAVIFPADTPSIWLSINGEATGLPGHQSLWISLLYLVSLILLLLFLNELALFISKKTSPWIGTGVLIVLLFLLRFASLQYDWSERFYGTFLFEQNIQETYLGESLGDLMINVILVLWVMIFFHRQFTVTRSRPVPQVAKWVLSTLNYFTIVIAILWITNLLRNLVLQSDFNVDFQNIFLLDNQALLTLSVVVLLLFALFLFTHRLMLNIVRIELPLGHRLITMILALIVAVPILLAGGYGIPMLEIMLFIFFYIMLFDVFIDSHTNSFTWMVIWLVVFSGFSSVLLYYFNNQKDDQLQLEYAVKLAQQPDSIAANRLMQFRQEATTIAKGHLSVNDHGFTKQLVRSFQNDPYLTTYYNFDSIGYVTDSMQVIPGKTILPGITFTMDSIKGARYFVHIDRDTLRDAICQFSRGKTNYRGLFAGIQHSLPYRGLDRLGKYQYAVYKDGLRIEGNARTYAKLLNVDSLPPPGSSLFFPDRQRKEVVYHNSNGNYVSIVGKEGRGLVRPLSLFSYIFALLVFVVILFTLLNTFVSAFPESFVLSVSKIPSLRNRIQLSVIAIIVISFVIIGFVTALYIQTSSASYRESRFEALSQSVLRDVEWSINQASGGTSLQDLLERVSLVHEVDLNIYGLTGELIATTMPAVYDKQFLSRKIDPVAFWSLLNLGRNHYIHESTVSTIEYSYSYNSIKDQAGNIQAILGVPYLHDISNIQRENASFMGRLLNVYVFLLLIAGIITIIVANSITRPLSVIGDKLKQVKLGKPNQALEWKVEDEIGDLISEYNRMIMEIEESARLLAKSEREGAWREMAMQVAHEIKNPLTPMKLSIQHLQRTYQADPTEAAPQIKKVTDTLIKQIDHLAHIASEFSNFAKLPAARKGPVNLNKVIESVYDLHKDGSELDITLDLPEETLQILGDPDHVTQVLTNLIINAKQSIPEERKGYVVIRLRRDNSMALIEVEDNGTGIPDDLLGKVFMPYFTTKHSGSGLGLAIAKNILEAMHGKISFETKWQQGTVFRVKLPLITE